MSRRPADDWPRMSLQFAAITASGRTRRQSSRLGCREPHRRAPDHIENRVYAYGPSLPSVAGSAYASCHVRPSARRSTRPIPRHSLVLSIQQVAIRGRTRASQTTTRTPPQLPRARRASRRALQSQGACAYRLTRLLQSLYATSSRDRNDVRWRERRSLRHTRRTRPHGRAGASR